MARILEIRYATSWDPAVLHYGTQGGVDEKWKDVEMQRADVDGWQSVAITLSPNSRSLEFVFKSRHSDTWDNPPHENRLGRKNYFVDLASRKPTPQGDQSERKDVIVVYQGEIATLTLPSVEEPPALLVTDLDGTLLGHDEYLDRFKKHWMLKHLWRGSQLVYNTGRNLKDFLNAAGSFKLPRPAFAILGVGTEIYTFPGFSSQRHSHYWTLLSDEERKLYRDDFEHKEDFWPSWCPERGFARLEAPWLQKQSLSFKREEAEKFALAELEGVYVNGNAFHDPLRLSVSVPAGVLREALADRDSSFCQNIKQNYKICVSGGGEWMYLDLLPKHGGKLSATLFVMEQLGFKPSSIRGICVRNAQPLLYNFLKRASHHQEVATGRGDDTHRTNKTEGTTNQCESATADVSWETTNPATEKRAPTELPFYLDDISPTPFVSISAS